MPEIKVLESGNCCVVALDINKRTIIGHSHFPYKKAVQICTRELRNRHFFDGRYCISPKRPIDNRSSN